MGAWNSILTYPFFGVSGRDAEENKKSRRKLCELLPPILWIVVGVILLILKLQHTEVGLLASAEEGKLLEALVGLDGEGFVKDISCVPATPVVSAYATRVGNDYFFTKDSLSEDDKGFWRCDRKVGEDDIEQPIYRFDNFNVTATAIKCVSKVASPSAEQAAACLELSGNEGVCEGDSNNPNTDCKLSDATPVETVEVEFRGKRHCDADGKHEFNAAGDQKLPSTCSQLGQALQVNNNVLSLWILQISSLVAIGAVQWAEIAASSDSPNKTDKTNYVAMIGGALLRALRLLLSLGFVLASLQIVLLSTWAYNHATQDSIAVADAMYDTNDKLKDATQINQLRTDTVWRLWWLVVASAATAVTFLQRDGAKAYRSVEESDKISLTGDSEPLTGVVGGLQGYQPLADGMIAKIVRNEMTKTKQVHNYY